LRTSLCALTAATCIYTLSLHDALPISTEQHGRARRHRVRQRSPQREVRRSTSAHVPDGELPVRRHRPELQRPRERRLPARPPPRSEEHTSELQSLRHLVCRLLLEKKKI